MTSLFILILLQINTSHAQSLPNEQFGAESVELVKDLAIVKAPYWKGPEGKKIPLSGDSTFDYVCMKFGYNYFAGGRGELFYMTVSIYGDYHSEIIKELYCTNERLITSPKIAY